MERWDLPQGSRGKGNADLDAEMRVENMALSILGGIQPDRLVKLGDLTSDGLLQRFLTVLMKPAKQGDLKYPVRKAEADYENLIKSINGKLPQNYHFADEACDVRDEVFTLLHSLETVDGFSTALLGAIGKLRGYFARICLVLHVARTHDQVIGFKCPQDFILADEFRVLDLAECLCAG